MCILQVVLWGYCKKGKFKMNCTKVQNRMTDTGGTKKYNEALNEQRKREAHRQEGKVNEAKVRPVRDGGRKCKARRT